MDNTYITLAIHTYDYAVSLRQTLEDNGIKVRLESVDKNENVVSSGVRVRIPESELPHALKIVETALGHLEAIASMKLDGAGDKVVIPVDFSPYSRIACEVGFAFAALMNVEVIFVHVYASPYFDGNLTELPNDGDYVVEITDPSVRKDLEEAAKVEMKRFISKVRKEIIAGKLPPVKFSTVILEGVPEDAILQYVRNSPPLLMVMATRGAHKKASQMVGSIAAEIIDNSRMPVFTVPENFIFDSFENLKNVVFFCNVDQQDLLAMDVFMRLFENTHLDVHLIPVSDRAGIKLKGRMEVLLDYCRQRYPQKNFTSEILPKASFRKDFEFYVREKNISLLVVPNKKKNAFSRLFNPGIAHKILFEKDIPMLALPV